MPFRCCLCSRMHFLLCGAMGAAALGAGSPWRMAAMGVNSFARNVHLTLGKA